MGHRQNSPFASIAPCPCVRQRNGVSHLAGEVAHLRPTSPARPPRLARLPKRGRASPTGVEPTHPRGTSFGLPGAPPRRANSHTSRWFSLTSAPVTCHRSARNVRGGRDPSTDSTTTVSRDACATEIPSRTLSCRRTRTHTRAPSALNAPVSRDRGPNARDSDLPPLRGVHARQQSPPRFRRRRVVFVRVALFEIGTGDLVTRVAAFVFRLFADSRRDASGTASRASLPAHVEADVEVRLTLNGQQYARGDALYSARASATLGGARRRSSAACASDTTSRPRVVGVEPTAGPSAGGTVAAAGPSHGSFDDARALQVASDRDSRPGWIDRVASTPSVTNSPAPSR